MNQFTTGMTISKSVEPVRISCIGYRFSLWVVRELTIATDAAFGIPLIDTNEIKATQKAARRRFKILIDTNHDLHPRDDTGHFCGARASLAAREITVA
jgi:hypothetical protein